MIVESGSVTMDLDVSQLNGSAFIAGNLQSVHFAVAANSFFSILVFKDVLRGPEPGSMALVPQNSASAIPASLASSLKQLVIEKLPSDAGFDLAVRDAKTGFTFFNVEGNQYDYDARAQLLSITGGRLLVSKELAKSLGGRLEIGDRKSTRLNSSHVAISYAVFCLKKNKQRRNFTSVSLDWLQSL